MRPATANNRAAITPCENICNTAPETLSAVARRGPAKQTHVTHTRITDDKFQITLAERHRRGINNSNDGQKDDPFAPHLEALRKEIDRHAEPCVRAQFHHDAGEKHRAGCRRRDVTSRRPRMQRPDSGEHGEAEKQHRKRPRLQVWRNWNCDS